MALIKCPECNKKVSDTCISCVHCGYKLKLDENDYLICPKCNSKVEKSRYCSECGLDLNNPDGLSNGRRIFYSILSGIFAFIIFTLVTQLVAAIIGTNVLVPLIGTIAVILFSLISFFKFKYQNDLRLALTIVFVVLGIATGLFVYLITNFN